MAKACLTTGKGSAAIATVCIFGSNSENTIGRVFRTSSKHDLAAGNIILGEIIDGEKTLDQVVLACEGPGEFAINCHGNPIIAQQVIDLLARNGAQIVSTSEYARFAHGPAPAGNFIEYEAGICQYEAKTLEGIKLILNQSKSLFEWAQSMLRQLESVSLDSARLQAQKILYRSMAAKYIIQGCTVVLAGPTNSGKSTLANRLSGRNNSIVADVSGTTRDYVWADFTTGPLFVHMIDTAGLTAELIDKVDLAAQEKTRGLIETADLVLMVLDSSLPVEKAQSDLIQKAGQKAVVVLNKSDLGTGTQNPGLGPVLPVSISAKTGSGIDELLIFIRTRLEVDCFDLAQPVCFNTRQRVLLEKISKTDSKSYIASRITELLNGPAAV